MTLSNTTQTYLAGRITVTWRGYDWHACITGQSGKWACGHTIDAVIGALVQAWGDDLIAEATPTPQPPAIPDDAFMPSNDAAEPVTLESTIGRMDYATAHQMWDNANRMFWSGQMEQKHYESICALAKARMAELEATQ